MPVHQCWLILVQPSPASVRLLSLFHNPFSNSLVAVSIRAYGAQQFFKTESLKRIDHFTKVGRTSYNLNRWIGIRIDLLGATFTTTLASYLLINRTLNAANIGFSLNMALDFCSTILWVVRLYNDFEVQANRYVPLGLSVYFRIMFIMHTVWNAYSRIWTSTTNLKPQKLGNLRLLGRRAEN